MTNAAVEPPFQRHVPLDVPLNFRDLGGYRTPEGTTKPGLIFRADVLSDLTAQDIDQLLGLGLKTVVDLRHDRELASEPNTFTNHATIRYLHRPLIKDASNIATRAEHLRSIDFAELNCRIVQESGSIIAEIFSLMAEETNLPLVFHCSGGRDRTGVLAALVLTAAGVDRQTVLDDYVLSNTYLAKRSERMSQAFREQGIDPAPIMNHIYLREQNLAAMLELIATQYGGIDPYFSSIGITADQLTAFRQNFIAN